MFNFNHESMYVCINSERRKFNFIRTAFLSQVKKNPTHCIHIHTSHYIQFVNLYIYRKQGKAELEKYDVYAYVWVRNMSENVYHHHLTTKQRTLMLFRVVAYESS